MRTEPALCVAVVALRLGLRFRVTNWVGALGAGRVVGVICHLLRDWGTEWPARVSLEKECPGLA